MVHPVDGPHETPEEKEVVGLGRHVCQSEPVGGEYWLWVSDENP